LTLHQHAKKYEKKKERSWEGKECGRVVESQKLAVGGTRVSGADRGGGVTPLSLKTLLKESATKKGKVSKAMGVMLGGGGGK